MPAAEALFSECCGSTEWARQMSEARPFILVEDLFDRAAKVWESLTPEDWIEAIGTPSTSAPVLIDTDAVGVKKGLAAASALYAEKFGFIFIPYYDNPHSDAALAQCMERLGNSLEIELRVSAREQQKIIEHRLMKLLEK